MTNVTTANQANKTKKNVKEIYISILIHNTYSCVSNIKQIQLMNGHKRVDNLK